jgi:hypothetical protein
VGLRFVPEIKDFMDDSIKSLSVKGVKWSATGGFLTTGTSFVVGLVIARILTPEDYGIVGMLSVFVAISQVFVNSGLFEVKPLSFTAQRGDLYLSAGHHVAMCQTQIPDMLSEFSINEKGGAYGGTPGDQTGKEASIHGYYNYP